MTSSVELSEAQNTVAPEKNPRDTFPHAEPSTSQLCIDDVIQCLRIGKFHYHLFCLCGIIETAEAVEVMFLTYIRDKLREDFHASETQLSLVPSAMFGGMLVGAVLWGVVGDIISRRVSLIGVLVAQVCAGAVCVFSPTIGFLILVRFFVGMGLGGGHVAPALFMELLPKSERGKYYSIFQTFWTIGVLLLTVVAFVLKDYSWRLLAAVCCAPYLLCLFFAKYFVESPKQLLLQNKGSEAVHVLRRIAVQNGLLVPVGAFERAEEDSVGLQRNHQEHSVLFTVNESMLPVDDRKSAETLRRLAAPNARLRPITLHTNEPSSLHAKVESFFRLLCSAEPHHGIAESTSSLRSLTILLSIIWMSTAFAYYGIIMLTTKAFLHENDATRSSANATSVPTATSSSAVEYLTLVLFSLGELPVYVLLYVTVEWYGRKNGLVVSPLVAAIALSLYGITSAYYDAATSSLLFYAILIVQVVVARSAILLQFDLVYLYTPEAFPTIVRTGATGLCSSLARVSTMGASFVAYSSEQIVPDAPFIIFGLVLFCSGVVAIWLPFDTRNRVLHDVDIDTSEEAIGMNQDDGANQRR